MFQAVVGHSDEVDTVEAIAEILAVCRDQLGVLQPHAGLLFCGTEYDREWCVRAINNLWPGLQLIGCTTDGEMSSELGFTEDAVTLLLFSSDQARFGAGIASGAGANPRRAAEEALAAARAQLGEAPRLAIVLPDGLTSSAHEVLTAMGDLLGPDVPIVGGMSADRVGGSKETYATFQFCGDRVLSDAIPVLLIGGNVLFSLGVESGWMPLGVRMRVTRATGTVVQELDGQPALALYQRYLGTESGENIAGLGAYPLAIYEADSDRYYLRVAKSADPETGAITFLGEVPVGAEVQITQAIRDSVIAGVDASVAKATAAYPGRQPDVALFFSCTGRKIALGTKTAEEISRARQALKLPIPMCGFYTFGEIGPVSDQDRARYHNTTFVTLLLGST